MILANTYRKKFKKSNITLSENSNSQYSDGTQSNKNRRRVQKGTCVFGTDF